VKLVERRALRGTGLRAACFTAAAALFGCGGGSPTSPDSVPSIVALGPQVLRITVRPSCSLPVAGLGMILARVTVTRSGSGWLASASSPDAGDVTLRFEASGGNSLPGTMSVVGTITGTVVHMPELLSVPSAAARATFGGGGTLDGVAFTAGSLNATTSGLDGIGTGSVTVTPDATGEPCTASSFSWAIFPPQ
jgi:hypothetical protein